MKNKPVGMAVTFNSLDEIMQWVEYAKTMKFNPKSLTLNMEGVVFGLPCEGNAAIDEMVAKAAAAIDAQPVQSLTADDMRKLFIETSTRVGAPFVRETMGRHGGTRLADIAEDAWPALARELRDA